MSSCLQLKMIKANKMMQVDMELNLGDVSMFRCFDVSMFRCFDVSMFKDIFFHKLILFIVNNSINLIKKSIKYIRVTTYFSCFSMKHMVAVTVFPYF